MFTKSAVLFNTGIPVLNVEKGCPRFRRLAVSDSLLLLSVPFARSD